MGVDGAARPAPTLFRRSALVVATLVHGVSEAPRHRLRRPFARSVDCCQGGGRAASNRVRALMWRKEFSFVGGMIRGHRQLHRQREMPGDVKPIPAIWRIDVEPDEFQPGPGLPPWTGFVAMAELVAQLRGRLADLSGTAVHPSWLLRLDPDIERAYGRADFAVEQYGRLIDELRAQGDPLGIHVHFYRWDEKRQESFSNHADEGWTSHCIDVATSTFERCFGGAPAGRAKGRSFSRSRSSIGQSPLVSKWT